MSTIGELQCESCGTTYPATGDFTNMLLPEDDVISGYNVTFKNPAVASIYETPLWTIPGRPPFEVELEFTERLLQPKHGGVLLDLSCGPGRTGRALAASRNFARIYGVDFSSAMLSQARQKRDAAGVPGYPLIRADCRRLPFAHNSFDAVYAGAALHVWPSLRQACSEVSRVLKPGGIWIASTFLVPWESALAPPALLPLIPLALLPPLSDLAKRLYPVTSNRPGVDADVRDRLRVFSIDDFKGLVEGAGLVNFECIRFMGWAIIKAEKPP